MSLVDLNRQGKIKRDDLGEFEELFNSYYVPLCNYVYSIIKDTDQSEEIVQEFFYTYWKNRKEISIKLSLKAYMYKSVRNSAIRYLQHKQIEEKYRKHAFAEEYVSSSNSLLEDTELMGVVENTLNQLPERCRQVFELSRFSGLKYHEIAEMLSISVKTVEADMTKALMMFRQNLGRYGLNTH
ncbi:MAG TPA: RNA polymerase sigma-70 factor [Tenuifilaceae bacterium]|nr:RNA polymerase sigma-70 factor [Tenuifilaceae bacterium]HOZ13442.1 RNA polymerase sigma-70 factor [Tenuifilaceae bacterium]HPI43708.1 RNA polymerase sigma-70 factor [Tenuifilaceae bacterium]HPN22843.1 RNA polymerase sigma-70 factor [Tenuifilaceae bacterium]